MQFEVTKLQLSCIRYIPRQVKHGYDALVTWYLKVAPKYKSYPLFGCWAEASHCLTNRVVCARS